jgi:hypothetical protein
LFVWQFLVHMVFKVYDDDFVELPAAVEAVLKENVKESGMIMVPHADSDDKEAYDKAMEQAATGFSLFGPVNLAGRNGFGTALGIQFVLNVLASALLMFVLLAASPQTLGSRVALVICFAVFSVLTNVIPDWNWWGYSWHYIGGQIGEQVVGWALVGLVFSKVMDKCADCCGGEDDSGSAEPTT